MDVVFQSHPDVVIATNTFRNVETILQYENSPLIQVGKFVEAGYTTKFRVYHSDGTHIADVKGSQIYLTKDGKNASVKTRYDPNLTACELEGRTILELHRDGPTALRGWAELYAPEGVLIKANDSDLLQAIRSNGSHIQVGGLEINNSIFNGQKIGIHVTRDRICIGGPLDVQSSGPFVQSLDADLGAGGKVTIVGGGGSISLRKDNPTEGWNP